MRNLHITKPRGINDANNPKVALTDGGRIQPTTDGRDLQKGYDCIYPEGATPSADRAVQNTGGGTGGRGTNGSNGNR